MEVFRGKLTDNLVNGLLLYAGDRFIPEMIKRYGYTMITAKLKRWSDPALKAGLGIVIPLIPQVRDSIYAEKFADLSFSAGVKDLVVQFIDKPALVIAEANNVLHGYNFNDITKLAVVVDGTAVASANMSVSGSPSDFKITLSTPLSAGEHDILVYDNLKAFYGKVRV